MVIRHTLNSRDTWFIDGVVVVLGTSTIRLYIGERSNDTGMGDMIIAFIWLLLVRSPYQIE